MVYKYTKKANARAYGSYSQETMTTALNEIRAGKISITAAAKLYKLPKGTLFNKFHNRCNQKPGGKTVLSAQEEELIVETVTSVSSSGFPIDRSDLCCIVKNYLELNGRNVLTFKNNMPGKDWTNLFLNRHKDQLSQLLNKNKKLKRAAMNKDFLVEYYSNIRELTEGLLPNAIFNFYEINLFDTLVEKHYIFNETENNPGICEDSTNNSVTLLFCGSADGTLLNPYIIYQGEYLHMFWAEEGPKGVPCCNKICCSERSYFNCTPSGWINAIAFEDWFKNQFFPHADIISDGKALICDNLSIHFSPSIINMCENKNVKLICLPSNATSLLDQPLHIAFFDQIMAVWTRLVLDLKKTKPQENQYIDKSEFPILVKKLINDPIFGPNIETNLQRGFKDTGIYPFDINQLRQNWIESATAKNLNEEHFRYESGVSSTFVDCELTEQKNPKEILEEQVYGNLDMKPEVIMIKEEIKSEDN